MIRSATEVAWAAGLFEGEGCITISHDRRGYKQPRIKIVSTDRDVIQRFTEIVGVGSTRIELGNERRGWKRLYEWYTGRRTHVVAVLTLLQPWLSRRRARRAKEVLRLIAGG